MLEQQLDLLSASGIPAEQLLPQNLALRPAVADLDDEALIAAIPAANLGDYTALAPTPRDDDWQRPFLPLRRSADVLLVLVLIAW
jgi:hypothetical protein